MVAYQRVQYQQAPQAQVVVSQAPSQKLQQVQYTTGYQYQPGYAYGSGYNYAAYPNSAQYGYGYYPGNQAYYQQTSGAYYPGSSQSTVYGTYNNGAYYGYPTGANYQGLSTSSYGVGDGSVYGGYNYHTPGSYFSAVRGQQVGVVKPQQQQQYGYLTNSVVSQAQQGPYVRRSSVTGTTQPIVGSSNYSIIQKRDVEAPKPAQPSQQEKASPEKPGQEKKTN